MANLNEISVPVRLKVLQDSISDFQKILDNLQPNTKNWRELNKLINSMSADAQKLQAQLSKPFSSQQQFNSTEKTIDKLEEAAARVSIVMQGLKFSDIKLTPDQTAELQKFNDEINQIRESYKQLQEQTKAKLLSNTTTSDLLGGLKGNVLSKSFSEIESAVDNHINNLKKKVNERDEQYKVLLSNKQLGASATQLITSGLSAGSLGTNIFDKFLRQTENGLQIKSWNTGVTKQTLLNAIGDMYHLEPGELQKKIEESLGKSLSGININEINKWFSEQGAKSGLFSGITRQGKNATANAPVMLQELNTLRAQVQEYETIKQEIDRLKNTDITPASTQNDAKIAELTGKMQSLQASIFSTASAMSNYKSAAGSMSQATNQIRNAVQETNAQFLRQQAVINSFNAMKTTVANFMGFYQVLNLTKRAIKEAANHIKELDSVMNKISIVTDMDTSDLWGQIDQYSKMAQTYGTTIKGAYEVSQIYYQQGLETADVLTLTNETLKLAKVSGLDYATTTDYMTTALRGFKMEMSEAATVVDVYSNLAANTAVSQEELAVAMSKTASSMESVGSSFEETSAMIATMVAVTRESATNIGSALKSIAARYGEMKSDPLAMTDSDGEELVYNKVDAALQSVGITLKDTEGQFRNFTDVITELAEKWDQLESTQQRYIATQFAGNRQQSRFLALVSNKDLLAQNLSVAENSEDVGTVQALKALDSLESKIEQVRVAYQQFYTTIGVESVWKGFLDGARSVVNTLNGMPKLFGKIPIAAINAISIVISLFKNLAFKGLSAIAQQIGSIISQGVKSGAPEMQKAGETLFDRLNTAIASKLGVAKNTGAQLAQSYAQGVQNGFINQNVTISQAQYDKMLGLAKNGHFGAGLAIGNSSGLSPDRMALMNAAQKTGVFTATGMNIFQNGTQQQIISLVSSLQAVISATQQEGNAAQGAVGKITAWATAHTTAAANLLGVSQALQLVALAIPATTRQGKVLSGTLQAISGAGIAVFSVMKAIGDAAAGGSFAMPWLAVASGIIAIINGISQAIQAASLEAKLEELTSKAEDLSDKAKQLKSDYKTLENSIKAYNELEEARYNSAEAADEYRTAVDKLADTYPQLIESYDENNEAVLNASAMDRILTEAREASARATLDAAEAEAKRAQVQLDLDKQTLSKNETSQEVFDAISWWTGNKGRTYANWEELNLVSGQGVDLELKNALSDLRTAARDANVEGVTEAYKTINRIVTDNGIKLSDDLSSGIDRILTAASAVEGDMNVIKAAKTTTVGAYLNSEYISQGKDLFSGKNSQGFLNFANREIEKRMQGETEFTSWTIAPYAKAVVESLDTSFGDLMTSDVEQLNQIFSSADKYTKNDLATLASELDIEIDQWVYDLFDDKTQENINFLKGKTGKLKQQGVETETIDTFLDSTTEMSLTQRQLMQSGLNQVQALQKNGQNPDEFISGFIDFYEYAATLPAQLRNSLIGQFESNGFTYEGLEQTQAWLDQNKGENATFDFAALKDTYIPNFSLSLQTMQSNLEDNLGDLESLFSDLSGGVKASKLDEAIAQAEKLGVTLTKDDFYTDGEKLVLKYEKFDSLITGMQDKYTAKTDNLVSMLNRAVETYFDDEGNGTDELSTDLDAIHTLLGDEKFNEFYENGALKAGVDEGEVISAIYESYNAIGDEYTAYNNWLAFLRTQFTKNIQWQHGEYEESLADVVDLTQGQDTVLDRIRYLAAHPGEMTKTERDSVDLRKAIETYQGGIKSLLSDITTKSANEIIANAKNYEGLSEDFVKDIAEKVQNGDLTTYQAIQQYAQEAGNTIAETNDLIVEALEKNTLRGSTKAASELAKGTFTLSDLSAYVSKYGVKKEGSDERDYSIDQFLDDKGQLTGPLADVYQWDEASAAYKATGTLDAVITAWENALDVTLTENSELYQNLIQGWTSDAIRDADKADWGKQMVSGISSLSSAKVGTRVDLSKSPELQAKLEELGYNVTDGYYEVTSEYARDSILLQLESTDAEVQATLRPLQEAIQAKRSRGNARLGISGTSFNQSDLDKYIDTFADSKEFSASTKQWYAEEFLGYKWDEDLQRYIATEEALAELDDDIAAAVHENKSEDYIKELRKKRGELAAHFRKDEKRDALSNLLSNYKDAADYIDEFNTQFGTDLEGQGIVSEVDGKSIVDVAKLNAIVPEYTDLFDQVISQIADEYINNAQKAGSLMTQGTTSKVEMDAFQKAYEEIMGEGSIANFIYDTVTHIMILDPAQLRSYLARVAAREEFGLTPEQQKDWVDSQIKALTTDNLDFSKVLDGSATKEDTDILKRNLEQYFITKAGKLGYMPYMGSLEAWAENHVTSVMNGLAEGGQAAIDAIKSTEVELSADEIRNAYRAQVAPLAELADTLSTLEVGSVVAKNQIESLTKAGFTVNADGVVQSTGDLVEAYRSIHKDMQSTNEATISELNQVVGNILDNRDKQQGAIDALSNATNMTYSQFVQIFSDAGVQITETMIDNLLADGTIKALGGNKMMISNFDSLVTAMQAMGKWEIGSEEYINALSAYRDGIIAYDKQLGDNIKANFDAIINAKVGDKINLTQLLSKHPQFEAELETAFGENLIENGILTIRDTLSLPALAVAIGNKAVAEGGMLADELEAFVASVHDNILNGITGAFGYSTNGTNSIATMQAFTQEFNTLTGENKDYSELFGYDTLFDTFKLNNDVYKQYVEAQKVYLEQLGLSGKAIDAYIQDQTTKVLQQNFDINGFIESIGTDKYQEEGGKLVRQIQEIWAAQGRSISESMAAQYVERIAKGGKTAVLALKQIADDNVSNEQLEQAFNHRINTLTEVLNEVNDLVAGQFIGTEGKLYEVLSRAGAVDYNGVVKAGFDMVEVYAAIYAEMTRTAGATTTGLNDAYAKLLTAQDQRNIDIVDTLKNGNGMSYADFGNLLAKYDIKFEDYMTQHWDAVMRDGFGNIRITDWDAFAKSIWGNNLDQVKNTPEYVSAFKAYNDGLIKLNTNTEKAITEEIKQIESAKTGDWLNLSQLWNAIEEVMPSADWNNSILDQLDKWGASLEDGILKIGENANLLGIARTLEQAAISAGLEIGNGLEEVKDTVLNILKSYADAIIGGIEGGLSNTDATNLTSLADNLGISNLHFEQTTEGLKLSQISAIELYQALAQVDSLQGKIVFDKLAESLKESNEHFTTTSALLSHIADLTTIINRQRSDTLTADERISDARLNQYKAELEVAKEIVSVRSAAEDESFNFMSNKIPAGQNNPLNYAKNWTQAIKAIKDAYKVSKTTKVGKKTTTGYMAYEDFYNIVNELNNMAGLGANIELAGIKLDGSLEAAAALINKGIETLTAVDTGDMMINIGELGINFQKSGSDLEKGMDAGIDAIADAQISAIDGMIAVLELIVQMEQLGDVAGKDMTIELPDIAIDEDGNGTLDVLNEKYTEWLKKFDNIYATNKQVQTTVDGIVIDGLKWRDWLHRGAEQWSDADAQILDALYQAAISSDWNLDDIGGSLQQLLNSGKFTEGLKGRQFTIDVGDITYTISNGVVVEVADWSNEQAQEVLKQYKKKKGYGKNDDAKVRSEIASLIQKYLDGEGATSKDLSLTDIIKIRHSTLIKHDKKGDYIEGPNGERYDPYSDEWNEAVQAAVLNDQQGISPKDEIKYDDKTKTSTVVTEYGIKNTIKMKATVGVDGKVTWLLDDNEFAKLGEDWKDFTPNDANTQAELLDQLYDYGSKEALIDTDAEGKTIRKEAWIYQTFGIHLKVQTEVYKDDGNGGKVQIEDPSKDPKFRQAIKEALEEPIEFESDGEGKTTITAKNGYSVVVDTDDITVDGEENQKLMSAKLREAMGIDEALKDTITEGITGAIPSLTEALGQLDAQPANDVAAAIGQISNNAETALKNVQELANALKGMGNDSNSPSSDSIEGAMDQTPIQIPIELDADGLLDNAKRIGQEVPNAIASGVLAGESNIQNAMGSIRTHIEELGSAAILIFRKLTTLLTGIQEHVSITGEIKFKTPFGELSATSGVRGENGKIKIDIEGQEKIDAVQEKASEAVTMPIKADPTMAELAVRGLIAMINTPQTTPVDLSSQPGQIQEQINSRTYTARVHLLGEGLSPWATGNIGLAKASGTQTLMGELGPELVVSNGRYFVAGQNGAEMVNLANDAIVFNHLQTEQLLKHGMSNGRGRAVTNERNAVAFAGGNVNGGPAMASASAALNALKQLRNMWESLRQASIQDLAGAAGGGGGGGGGDKTVDPGAWIDTVERWYNLMQEIAKLEKQITHEEQLRSKIQSEFNANGEHYYASQKRSLAALQQQIKDQEQLNLSREAYYDQRRRALQNSAFGKIYTFDEQGQLKFQSGGMEFLADLVEEQQNPLGKPKRTNKEKYDILMKNGFGAYMQYTTSGEQIKQDSDNDGKITEEEWESFYETATQAWWDRINAEKDDMQSLWDNIEEGRDNVLELLENQNEIVQEIRDNQMEVENSVLKAIEDMRQREIDALQDERDKLEESTGKYIEGLSDALSKEQQMYDNQQTDLELNQKRRRLGILERSGGSAQDIASLRAEIEDSERDRYFDLQQQQIDAIQEASDLQLERMDSQIEIMTESLEYQKEYGLLWSDVYAVMQGSAEQITSFITNQDSEYWKNSALASAEGISNGLFQAEQWETYRDDHDKIAVDVHALAEKTRADQKASEYATFDKAMQDEFGKDYDKNGKYKELFMKLYEDTFTAGGDMTKVGAMVNTQYRNDKKAAEDAAKAKKKAEEVAKPSATITSSSGNGNGGQSKNKDKITWTTKPLSNTNNQVTTAIKNPVSPTGASLITIQMHSNMAVPSTVNTTNNLSKINNAAQNLLKATPKQDESTVAAAKKVLDRYIKSFVKPRASGGYVNHGLYELGEQGTETVFTASQTKILRDNILSNRPNSLISLLHAYNENYDNISNPLGQVASAVEDNSTTIEKIELNMTVQQMSNDYDAKRAGEQVINEIMRIARKTNAANSVGR